jgi:hypothetical protein
LRLRNLEVKSLPLREKQGRLRAKIAKKESLKPLRSLRLGERIFFGLSEF